MFRHTLDIWNQIYVGPLNYTWKIREEFPFYPSPHVCNMFLLLKVLNNLILNAEPPCRCVGGPKETLPRDSSEFTSAILYVFDVVRLFLHVVVFNQSLVVSDIW